MLLVTAPTVRPGLLSWRAWQALAGAARVLAPSAGHPLLPALDEAGIGWTVLPGDHDVLAGGDEAASTARRLAQAGSRGDRHRSGPARWCGSARRSRPAVPRG